jgi:hypothetical protein
MSEKNNFITNLDINILNVVQKTPHKALLALMVTLQFAHRRKLS